MTPSTCASACMETLEAATTDLHLQWQGDIGPFRHMAQGRLPRAPERQGSDTNGNKYFHAYTTQIGSETGLKEFWALKPRIPPVTMKACSLHCQTSHLQAASLQWQATATIDVRHPRLVPRAPESQGSRKRCNKYLTPPRLGLKRV